MNGVYGGVHATRPNAGLKCPKSTTGANETERIETQETQTKEEDEQKSQRRLGPHDSLRGLLEWDAYHITVPMNSAAHLCQPLSIGGSQPLYGVPYVGLAGP